jgi:hypothetical protein
MGGRRKKRLQVDIEAAYLNAEVKGTIYVQSGVEVWASLS